MRTHLFLILQILFLLIFGCPSLALDLAHWDEKQVRSNSSTIWMSPCVSIVVRSPE